MPEWHLFAVGVNMTATIEDTQDLSTVRGAGLALLRMPDQITAALTASPAPAGVSNPKMIYTGASEGLWRFTASDADARKLPGLLRKSLADKGSALGRALRHMRVLLTVAPCAGAEDAGGQKALAAARFDQYRTVTVPAPEGPAAERCGIDHVRPGDATIRTRPGQIGPHSTHEADDKDTKGQTAAVSSAVKDRRAYGRAEKHAFYTKEGVKLSPSIKGVTETFQDMVKDPPKGLREAVKGKLALIYADGNAFGEIRERLSARLGADKGLTKFSTGLADKRRTLLGETLRAFQNHETKGQGRALAIAPPADGPGDARLRFETLLWGGDELIWVMPAWAAWDALNDFFTHTREWEVEQEKLTHAVGMVLFQAKTPIRLVKSLAHDLADSAKAETRSASGRRNVCQVLPLESHDVPPGFLEAYRTALFGARVPDQDSGQMSTDPAAFTLDGDTLPTLTVHLRERVFPCFPRSQLYRLLREATARDWLRFESDAVGAWWDAQTRAGEADPPLAKELREVLAAGKYTAPGRDDELTTFDLLGGGPAERPALPAMVNGQPHPPLALAGLATLWDYIDPFGEWS